MHGGSRPFFQDLLFSLSVTDSEKEAFERLHQGLPPESTLDMGELPASIPVNFKHCDESELDGFTEIAALRRVQMTVDPKHIKLHFNALAELGESLDTDLTHHTVVTVEDVTLGGFAMSPMVLYDGSGSVCGMFDNLLHCPIPAGAVNFERKVKIPGLDAVASMPKRLYNFQIKLMQGERLASCSHFYLDLRPDEEKATNPTPGTPLLAEVSATPSASMSMSLSPSITASESVSPSPSPSLDERMLSSLRAEMTKLYAMVRDSMPKGNPQTQGTEATPVITPQESPAAVVTTEESGTVPTINIVPNL